MKLRETSILRKLWRKLLLWRFRRERRSDEGGEKAPAMVEVGGRFLVVLPGVFDPKLLRSGAFFADCLSAELVPPRSRALDMGTGSGIGALVASAWAREVIAVDIHPAAVRCARVNALMHGLEAKIDVRQGDLFEPVAGERFDVVLFNPPYFRGEPRDLRDRAWRSPDLDARFASGLDRHLTPEGHALVCLSTDGELSFLEKLRQAGFSIDVVAERDLLNEIFRLYRVRAPASSA